MFRGKETGNKTTRRISAAILALVLIITSINVDWNVLRATADWGIFESLPSGTIVAFKHSVQNTNRVNTASVRVRGVEGDEITATLVGIRKNMTYSPMDGTEIPFGGLVSVGGTTAVSYTTGPINLSTNGGEETIIFDLSKVSIVLAANENVAIMIKVESKLGYQVEVNSYKENFDGFISQNANDFSKWYEFNQMIEITQESATGDLLEPASVSTNIPEVTNTPTISLALGQSFTIAAEVQPGYYRTIDYKEPDAGQDIYAFDRLNTTVIGKTPGTSTLTIAGDGVSPVPVTVNVIDIAAVSSYPYTGAPVELSLTPSMGTATAPLATDFEIRHPATNVGSYTAEIVGKSNKYPGFATTVNYNITPIDLAETDIAGDLVNKITPEEGKFYVDPSTGQVVDSSKFDLTIGGVKRTFVYGTDFNATAVFDKEETQKRTDGKYTYNITITGKGNLINSQTVTFSETVNTSTLRLKDMYSVTLNQTEIIWDGVTTTPIPEPQLTFVNKITGTTFVTKPGDVTVNYTDSEGDPITGTGAAKVTVTSNVYDVTPVQGMSNSGPIVLNYTIKQKIDNNTVVIELEKPSYVEEMVNGSYVERTPSVKVKLISGTTPAYIDPYYYDVIYSNNTRAGVATVTVVGKNDSLYSGSASTTFRILPNLEKDAWISIGGVVNHEKPNDEDYAKASNGWVAAYSATYTGDVIEVFDNQIEILIDGVVLDHRYYHVDASGYGLNANGIRDGKAGVDVGPKNGSVLIKTTEEYGEQSIRVYFAIVPCELKDISINPIDSGKYSTARTYTGKDIKLEETQEYKDGAFTFRVTAKNGKVVDASEYTLEYSNNIDTGTATLVAVGKDGSNYIGRSAGVGFEILPYIISGSKFTVDPIGDQSFIGVNAKVEPKPIMYFDGTPVTNTTGFDFAYSNNEKISTTTKPATITITGGGNFEGTKKVNFNIVSKSITNSSVRFIIGGAEPVPAVNGRIDSSIKLDYDGGRQMPSLEIRDNGQLLTQGVDYQVRPANNINIKGGTDTNPPSMTITGIGNYGSSESNTVLITFTIGPRSINASNVAVTIDPDTHRLTKVEDSGNKARKTLIEGVDYEVRTTGRNNDVEWDGSTGGDYTMYITGIGNYTGVKEQYFTHGTNVNSLNVTIINPVETNISRQLSVGSSQSFIYLGGNRPFVKITDSAGNVVNTGFTYEFINAGEGAITASNVRESYILRVTGDGGNYFGVADFRYNETTANFYDEYTSGGTKTKVEYRNDFSITVNGVPIDSEKKDSGLTDNWYTFKMPYMEDTILKDDEIPVRVIFKPFNRTTITDYIPKNLNESDVEVTISGTLDLTQETKGSEYRELIITAGSDSGFQGSKTVKYTVKKPDISGARVTGVNDEYTYKAENYTPDDFPNIVVTLEGKSLVRDRDYTVTVEAVNTPGGKAGSVKDVSIDTTTPVEGAQVVIKGKGEYDSATKVEKTFKIMPKNITDTDVYVEAPSEVGKGTTAPLPTITYKDSPLIKDADYVVTGNTTTTPGSVTMTITGKGNFAGEVKKTYTVKEAFSESTVIVEGVEDTYYIDEQGRITGANGNRLSTVDGGDVEVYLKDGTGAKSTPLVYGTDFTIRLNPDSFKPGRNRAITLEGINDYTGNIRYYPVTVYGKFTEANVSGLNPRIEYSGNSVESSRIKVKFQGDELVENTHYTVEFSYEDGTPVTGDVKDVGSYKAVIKGKATSSYVGSTATIPFQITKRKTTGITVEIKPEWEYTGNLIDVSASLTVKDGDIPLNEDVDYIINGKGTGTPGELVTANLTAKDPGSYTITITGKGNYEGEKSVSYNVVADINKLRSGFASDATAILTTSNGEIAIRDVVVNTAAYDEVGEIENSVTYTPPTGGITPSYTVSYEGSLVPGSRGNIVVEGQSPYYKGKITVVPNARVYGLIEEVRWMNASTETDENDNPIYAYTGSVINPITSAVFELNGTKLTTSSYSSGPVTPLGPPTNTGKEVGDYRVTLKGAGFYLGSKDIEYGIRYDLANATVTLEPTSYIYDGQEKIPKVTVKVRDKSFVNISPGADDLDLEAYFNLTLADNINAGTATVTVSGDSNHSINAVTKTFKIDRANKANNMQLALVGGIGVNNDEFVYTGDVIKPDVTVEVDNTPLVSTNPAHAYTVTYPANPVSVGTYKAIVELTGSYSGKGEISYKIVPKSIGTATITITAEDVYYTGKKAKPVVTVTDGGNPLVEGRDYTVSIPETAVRVQENVPVTIEGKGNYIGTLTGNSSTGGTFNILPIDIAQVGVLTVTGNSKVYDGVAVSSADLKNLIEVTVRSADGSAVKLDPNTDYEISWKNNDPVTNGSSMVSAVGHDFEITASSNNDNMAGIYTGTYVISKKQLNNDGLVYTDAATTGYKSKIGVNSTEENGIRYANKDILDNADFSTSVDQNVVIKDAYIDLQDLAIGVKLYDEVNPPTYPQVDVVYSGNDMAGIATVKFVAKENSNYTGEVSFRFKIGKDITGSEAGATINPTTYVYDGLAKTPEVTTFTYGGRTLDPDTDYKVSYEDNPVNVGTHYVYIRGNGKNYYGEVRKPYTITKRSNSFVRAEFKGDDLIDGYMWKYNGSPARPEIVVYDKEIEGKVIDPADYTVTYSNNTGVGTASYRVSMKDNSNYVSGSISDYGSGNTFQIVASELETENIEIRLSGISPYTFTGRQIRPSVSVYYNGSLVSSSNYKVTYTDNIIPGTATVTVSMEGNYEGYAYKTFDIVANLASTDTIKVTAADRTWTGSAVDASGIKAYLVSTTVEELKQGEDYEVEISPVGNDWSKAVRAKAVLTGISDRIKGSRTVYFNLNKELAPEDDPSNPGWTDPDKPDPLPDDPDQPGPGPGPTPGGGKDLSSAGITATVIAPAGGFTYNGSPFTPSVTVTDGGRTLTRGSSTSTTADYYVTYRNNVNAGTAYADIIGINAYSGTISRTFTIKSGSGSGTGTGSTITIPGFYATAQGSNSAKLSWGNVSGVTGYNLTWRGSNGTNGSQSVAAGSTSATVNNLSPGVTYTFTLTATGSGNSTGTAQASCTTTQSSGGSSGSNITPVSGFEGMSAAAGTATLSWINPQDGTYYEVYRSTSPSNYGSYIGSVVNGGTVRCVYYDRNNLVSGRTYYYWVRPYRYVNGSKILGSYSAEYIRITVR